MAAALPSGLKINCKNCRGNSHISNVIFFFLLEPVARLLHARIAYLIKELFE